MMLCASLSLASYVFLNLPESIREAGYTASFDVVKDEKTRVFFHFCNKTKEDLYFTAPNVNMYDAKYGVNVNYSPGVAGARAVYAFYKSKPSNIDSIKILVPSRQTISGIIEGKPKDIRWMSYFNSPSDMLLNQVLKVKKVGDFELVDSTIVHDLQFKNDRAYVRFGHEDMQGFKGSFGVSHKFRLANNTDKNQSYEVKVSPRGGNLIFAYNSAEGAKHTPLLLAKRWYSIEKVALKPKEEWWMENIVTGGFNYPVQIGVVATTDAK